MKSVLLLLLSLLSATAVRAQCEPTLNCPASSGEVADLGSNDVELWNDLAWWDPIHIQHNLAEMPVELKLEAYDLCGTGLVGRLELLLDLDSDGVQETVLDSDSMDLYEPGKIPFGNYNNPAYDGTRRVFDQRPVSAGDRYRFALVHTAVNDNHVFRLVWTTDNAPDVHVDPQLPTLGAAKYTVRWTVHDDNDDYSYCNYDFTIADKKKPTVVCINGLSTNIMQTQLITLWASDFYQYAEDNISPSNLLKFGVRKSGTGTGFPLDASGNPATAITFTCSELGTQFVEVWAIDAAGNADFCETYVLVQDNMGNCNIVPGGPQVCIDWCGSSNLGLEDVQFLVEGQVNGVPIAGQFFSFEPAPVAANCYEVDIPPSLPANATIRPVKDDNPLNGISTYDLVLMQRHILGIELLANPCSIIAADANRSNTVTLADYVELRKLILGIYSELPNNPSWRFFVEPETPWADPLNPFEPALIESLPVIDILDPSAAAPAFRAVKIGDLNGSALPNGLTPPTGADLALAIADRSFEGGTTIRVPVTVAQAGDLLGLQLALEMSGALELQAVEPGAWRDLTSECFATHDGGRRIHVSWATARRQAMRADDVLFTLVFRTTRAGRLADAVSLAPAPIAPEAYNEALERQSLLLRYPAPDPSTPVLFGAVRPNPAPRGAIVEIPVHVTAETEVTYEITDLAGRVLVSGQSTLQPGESRLGLPTQRLTAAGWYGYRVRTGSENLAGRIVIGN